MQTRVITVTSGKGGVGKSTSTASLGVALALLGKRVVVIDTDVGLRNLDILLGLQNRIIYDIVDFAEGRCRVRQALIRDKELDELYLLPAAQTRDKTAISAADLIRVCNELRGQCDYILIDCPAGIEHGFRNAIAPAEEFIVVTTPGLTAVQDADRVIGILETEKNARVRLLVNRYRSNLAEHDSMLSLDDIRRILAVELLAVIPEDENVLLQEKTGRPVTFIKSPAGGAFTQAARRIIDPSESLPSLEQQISGNRLSRWVGRLFGERR